MNDAVITDIPMGGSDRGAYTSILSALLASDHCDAVVSVIGSSSLTNPNVIADRVLKAEPKSKPLAVYLAPRADNGLLLLAAAWRGWFSYAGIVCRRREYVSQLAPAIAAGQRPQ